MCVRLLPVFALTLVSFACHSGSGGAEVSGGAVKGDDPADSAPKSAPSAPGSADRIVELWYTGSLNG